MSNLVVEKKLEQILSLLSELEKLLDPSVGTFTKNSVHIRAAERDFQLIVDLASDINAFFVLAKTSKTPDSYRESFLDMAKIGILDDSLAQKLSNTARVRNILVHEYDFEEDYVKFYAAAKESIDPYRQYTKVVFEHIS